MFYSQDTVAADEGGDDGEINFFRCHILRDIDNYNRTNKTRPDQTFPNCSHFFHIFLNFQDPPATPSPLAKGSFPEPF